MLSSLLEERNKHLAYEGLTSTGGRKPDLPNISPIYIIILSLPQLKRGIEKWVEKQKNATGEKKKPY